MIDTLLVICFGAVVLGFTACIVFMVILLAKLIWEYVFDEF